MPKITFFGMVLPKDGISASETKIEGIKKLQKPEYIAKLRSFLGLATFLGSFIPKFADIVDLFWKLLRKGENWEWGNQNKIAPLRYWKKAEKMRRQ